MVYCYVTLIILMSSSRYKKVVNVKDIKQSFNIRQMKKNREIKETIREIL